MLQALPAFSKVQRYLAIQGQVPNYKKLSIKV